MSDPTSTSPHAPEPAHGHTEATPHHHVNYYAVFGTLVVLTIVTVAVAFMGIKNELAKVLLALLIASIKASAVVLYFMHMKFEGKMIYVMLILPLCLCVLLICALLPDVTFGHVFNNTLWEIWRHVNHP
jgi:cytochrome c oxidase subunit IV